MRLTLTHVLYFGQHFGRFPGWMPQTFGLPAPIAQDARDVTIHHAINAHAGRVYADARARDARAADTFTKIRHEARRTGATLYQTLVSASTYPDAPGQYDPRRAARCWRAAKQTHRTTRTR